MEESVEKPCPLERRADTKDMAYFLQNNVYNILKQLFANCEVTEKTLRNEKYCDIAQYRETRA